MSLVFATTFFFFFFLIRGGGVLRHSAVQTDFEFEISGPLQGHKVINYQLSGECTAMTDQTGPISRLIWVYDVSKCHIFDFVTVWLNYPSFLSSKKNLYRFCTSKYSRFMTYLVYFQLTLLLAHLTHSD